MLRPRSDRGVAVPTCFECFLSHSCTISLAFHREEIILNCRIEMEVETVYVSSARADWLIAVYQSELGDTLIC